MDFIAFVNVVEILRPKNLNQGFVIIKKSYKERRENYG
jgi:hypothetical protein